MTGTTPAVWFIEVNGQKQGPFTAEDIKRLLMDGALKIESRIYDSVADTWKIAADVIPYLELGTNPSQSQQSSWQPPPRPVELRDTHVVDLKRDTSPGIDYFALISDGKRELERVPQNVKKRPPEAPQKVLRHLAPSPASAPAQSASASKGLPTKVSSKPAEVVASQPKTSPAVSSLKNDGILTTEVDDDGIFGFVTPIREFVLSYYKPLAMAAGLSFVFIGTYGVVRSMNEKTENRVPAADEEKRASPTPKPIPPPGASGDSLGTGKHPVSRQGGTASLRNRALDRQHSRVAEAPPVLPQNTPESAPPDEAAQFISTTEIRDELQGVENQAPPTPQSEPPPPQNAELGDTSGGYVDPPGYIPPADPGYDGERAPTSDPNVGQ